MLRATIAILLALFLIGCAGTTAEEGSGHAAAHDAVAGPAGHHGDDDEDEGEPELPPADSLSICEISEAATSLGYGTIVEAEFEDGSWEVEAVMDGEVRTIYLDPLTGELLPDREEDDDDA